MRARAIILPTAEEGRIDLDDLKRALACDTALVSIMGANNEAGVIHPVADIAVICVEAAVPYHCDLTQLAAYMPVDQSELGVTLANGSGAARLPKTLNVSIEGVDPHALQHRLRDQLIFSTGSACSTDKVHASPVLTAMFGDGMRARNGSGSASAAAQRGMRSNGPLRSLPRWLRC